ncbi:MAG TPA: CcdB family protein [Caulobacteraceae bacterium]
MQRFDIYDSPSGRNADLTPYVVVLQSHYLDGLPSVVVAPLIVESAAEKFPYLSVPVVVGGDRFVVSLHELIAVDVRSLKQKVGNVLSAADAIDRGLQRLFSGF